jgi:hypothetical protein
VIEENLDDLDLIFHHGIVERGGAGFEVGNVRVGACFEEDTDDFEAAAPDGVVQGGGAQGIARVYVGKGDEAQDGGCIVGAHGFAELILSGGDSRGQGGGE